MPFELTLLASREPAIADGPIRLGLEIRNIGDRELSVPHPGGGPSPFQYSIYNSDGSELRTTASQAERMNARIWLGDRPEIPSLMAGLPPGLAVSYDDDLMSLLTEALAPGKYLVEASYDAPNGETGTSPRVGLEIELSQPMALAQDIEIPQGRIVIAEWHRKASAGALLRVRETDALQPLGRFFDLHPFEPANATPPQCALSTRAAYGVLDRWRWVAWLDGANLLAGAAHYDRWLYPTQPIPLDLENPALLPYGYTLADGGAVFAAAGESSGGPQLRLVRIPLGQEAQPMVTDIALANLPEGTPRATCLWNTEGAPELVFGWTVENSGATTIVLAKVNALTGEMTAAPKAVFVTLRPVLELNFPPAASAEEERRAQLLLGPGPAGERHFTQIAFDIRNPSTQISKDLPEFEGAGEDGFSPARAERWVLPSEPYSGTPVLAVANGQIWAATASRKDGDGWRRIAEGEIEGWTVRLWAFSPDRLLCTWFDRTLGYRSRWLPSPGG
jgi:hypothetical protein